MPELSSSENNLQQRIRVGGLSSAAFDAAIWHDDDADDGRVFTRSRQGISGFAYDDVQTEDWHPSPAAAKWHQVHRNDSLWISDGQTFRSATMRHHDGYLTERISSEALQDLDSHRLDVATDLYSGVLRDLLPSPVCQEVEFVQAEDDSFYRLTVLVDPAMYADAGRLADLHMQVEDAISVIAPEFEGYFSLRFRRSNGTS